MNINSYQSRFLLILSLCIVSLSFGQVGIGNTNPDASSLLMVDDGLGDKGVLLPQVALTATSVAAPVVAPATSLLIYNTATAGAGTTAVTPGYYYWDGAQWVRLLSGAVTATGISDDWALEGNAGTIPGVGVGENYIGTSDDRDLVIASNGTKGLTLSRVGQQLQAGNDGTSGAPTYSFESDTDLGIYRTQNNTLNFSAAGVDKLEIGPNATIFNEPGDIVNFRIESNNDDNTFFINGATDDVGVGTATPNARLEIRNNIATAEAPITRFTSGSNTTLDILQPANGQDDPFTFQTNNAFAFRVDATDRVTIDSAGEVGINNTNPQTDIHIGGATNQIRVDAFNAANNAENDGTRTVPVHADADGNLLIPNSPANSRFIYNGLDPIGLTTVDTDTNGGQTISIIADSGEFTLTQTAMVHINYATAFIISTLSDTALNDSKAKLIRSRLNIVDVTGGGVILERGGHDSVSHTNEAGPGSVSIGGFFNTAGATAVLLNPGTYRVDLEVNVLANTANNGNVSDAFRTQWLVEHLKVIATY